MTESANLQSATFGGGCFWCTEAVFVRLNGVESVISGYAGGDSANPTYEEVCTGATGHAEVIQIRFNPQQISFQQLLEVFFATHDPTTLNRQGNDRGTQYRSVIFVENDDQRRIAEESIRKLDELAVFSSPLVTEISPLTEFHPAEEYHQDYYQRSPQQPYCNSVIPPKLEKLRGSFSDLLKPDA